MKKDTGIKIQHYLVYEGGTEVELKISGDQYVYARKFLAEANEPYKVIKLNIPPGTRGFVITNKIVPVGQLMDAFKYENSSKLSLVPCLLDIFTLGYSIWISEENVKPVVHFGEQMYVQHINGVPVSILKSKPNFITSIFQRLFKGITYEKITLDE